MHNFFFVAVCCQGRFSWHDPVSWTLGAKLPAVTTEIDCSIRQALISLFVVDCAGKVKKCPINHQTE